MSENPYKPPQTVDLVAPQPAPAVAEVNGPPPRWRPAWLLTCDLILLWGLGYMFYYDIAYGVPWALAALVLANLSLWPRKSPS